MGLATITTDISGFDELLGGGIPKGSSLLISGPPGAGKTLMALQYTFNQARKGERVLFVSTCELLYSINKFASTMSFFDLGLIRTGVNLDFAGAREEGGFVEFWDYSLGPILEERYAGDIFDVIQEKVGTHRIDHLIIDSITSINMFLGDEVERRKKLLLFMGWVSRSGCTTIFTDESYMVEGAERLLTDGIVELERRELPGRGGLGVFVKTIEVLKLRGHGHSSGRYMYRISEDGVSVIAPGSGEHPSKESPRTGVEELDRLVGGMAYGSAWHFNIGAGALREPLAEAVVGETLRSGDNLIYVASPYDDLSIETFQGHFGAEEIHKGRVVILDLYCRCPADKLKDAVISIDPAECENIPKALLAHVCTKGKRCRILMDTGTLVESLGPEKARKVYTSLLGHVHGKNIMMVTLRGEGNSTPLSDDIEQSSAGVVDLWDYGGYVLLQIKKAPYARSFEPYVVRLKDRIITLQPL
jgi:circadian clock protein KaiC